LREGFVPFVPIILLPGFWTKFYWRIAQVSSPNRHQFAVCSYMRNHDDPGQDTTCDWPLQYRRADINNGEQQAAKSGTSICHPSLWERAGRKLTKEPEHLKMAGTCFGVDIFVDSKKQNLTINQQTSHLKTWAENDDCTVYKEH
jgi:hypothetical protein